MYQLLVGGYSANCFDVRGRLGAVPDRRHARGLLRQQCHGSRLPDYIDQLEFRRIPFNETTPLPLTAFNDMQDFHVVTEQIKEFIANASGAAVETAAVRTTEADGRPTEQRYFALKVLDTVECIDPLNSTGWRHGRAIDSKIESFRDIADECELVDSLCQRFANHGPSRYRSYPWWRAVNQVKLIDGSIPQTLKLFHPAYWPGQLLIEQSFAAELSRFCFQHGYEFWTLCLTDPQKDYDELMRALR